MVEKMPLNDSRLDLIGQVCGFIKPLVPDGSRLYLFGSFARGEERTSSDIDIAIDAIGSLSVRQLAAIRFALEDSTIPYSVDVIDLHRASAQLKHEILKEGLEWTDYPWR